MTFRGKSAAVLASIALTLSAAVAVAAPTSLTGRVVDQRNQPVANVAVSATQAGALVGTAISDRDGAYSLDLEPGAYSLSFTPPTKSYAELKAYDIIAPRTTPLTVQLTAPMKGRVNLTGTVTLSNGTALASDTTVYFDNKQGSIGSTKTFRLAPTAGAKSTLTVKGADNGNFSFRMYGQTTSFNQDAYINLVVPVQTQRVRVVTADGTPIARAVIDAGLGSWGSSVGTMAPIEGLGTFTATWNNKILTDSQGWASITYVPMATAETVGFRVTAPSSVPYLAETFLKATGSGEITLTMTQRVSVLAGSVKDQNGAGLNGVTLMYGSVSTSTDTSGNFSKQAPAGTMGNFTLYYSVGSERTTGSRITFSPFGLTARALDTSKSHTFVIPMDTVTVRVVDAAGLPVPNAHVLVTDADGYAPRGRYTLIPDLAAYQTSFAVNGMTNSKGLVTLRTPRLDTAILGVVQVTPPLNGANAPSLTRAMVGTGGTLDITLPRPTVSVSGIVKTSDGTALTTSRITFADNQGNGGSATLASDGSYSMTVPMGTKGQWTLGCATEIVRDLAEPLCVRFTGLLQTINTASKQDFTIPTYRTTIKVVDATGKGIPNVLIKASAGHDIVSCRPMISVGSGQVVQAAILASATSETNGVASLPMIGMTGCVGELTLTPPVDSRYQDRTVRLTLGTTDEIVIVLEIPAPTISSAVATSSGSGKTITVLGENLLGTYAVTLDGVDIPDYRVINASTITVAVPTTFAGGRIELQNGGGSASADVVVP